MTDHKEAMKAKKRGAEFEDWLEVCDIPLPVEPMARAIAVEGLRRAFNAGWNTRSALAEIKGEGND